MWPGDQGWNLTRPQTAFYGLVLEEAGSERLTPSPRIVERLALDYISGVGTNIVDELPPSGTTRIRAAVGALLDHARDGRWLLAPHPAACPKLDEGRGFCAYQDLCRLRSEYAPERGAPDQAEGSGGGEGGPEAGPGDNNGEVTP